MISQNDFEEYLDDLLADGEFEDESSDVDDDELIDELGEDQGNEDTKPNED